MKTVCQNDKSQGSISKQPGFSYQTVEESTDTNRMRNEETELGPDQIKKLPTCKEYPASESKSTSNDKQIRRKKLPEELHQKRASTVEQPLIQQTPKQTDIKTFYKKGESEGSISKQPGLSYQTVEESRGTKRVQNVHNELGDRQVKKVKISEEYSASGLKSTSNDKKIRRKKLPEELHQKRASTVEQPIIQQAPKQREMKTVSKKDKSEGSISKQPGFSYQAVEESRGTKRKRNVESELGAGQEKRQKISEEYSASGLKSSLHGTVYQLKLLMLFLKRGLDQGYNFNLATEMDAAEKFDDVIFQYMEDGEEVYRFLQAKHKQDQNKKITVNDLLTEHDSEFSLQKYFISYRKIEQNPKFKGYKLKDFIICTNIDLEENLKNSFEPVEDEEHILGFKDEKPKRLKINLDAFPNMNDLVLTLRKTSELQRLAKRLAKCVLENKPLSLKDNLFRSYHGVLGEKVIDAKNAKQRKEKDKGKEVKKNYAKFHDNFLNGSTQELEKFRTAFLRAYQEISEEQINVNEFWEKMKARELQISQTFGRTLELDNDPQLTDPQAFAKAIANAMSVAEQNVVSIKREKRKGVIKDNINKLAGHVLVKKDEEKNIYYLSSAFFDDGILMGNLECFKSMLKAELESKAIEVEKDKYKFRIADFKRCEEELHLKTVLPDDYIDKEDIESFFEKLVFAVNQPNEIKLGEIIETEMGEDKYINLIDCELIVSKFLEVMLNWMKEKRGSFFTQEDGKAFFKEVKQKMFNFVVSHFTLECHRKIKDIGIAFSKEPPELSNFLASHKKQIFILINQHNTIFSLIKVDHALKYITEYQKNDSHIFVSLSSLLQMKDDVIKAFESEKSNNLLVIHCKDAEENVDELCNQLSKVVHSRKNKKIILIAQENDPLVRKFKNNFSKDDKYEERKDEENRLIDLKDESQKKLLNKGKIVFQGEEVSLGTLIDESSKNLIDGEVLSKLLNNEKIEIGKALTDSKYNDVKDYYIDRTINRHVKIDIKEENCQFYFTLDSEVNKKKLKKHQDIVLTSDTGKSFKELCNKYNKYNIHWCKNDLMWQQSHGDLSKLRKFVDTNKQSIQEYRPQKITDINDRVVIIAAEPGMGKSTILTHLAVKTKDSNPSLWTVKINLLDFSAELEGQGIIFNEAEAIKFIYKIVEFQLFQKKKEETTEEREQRAQMVQKVLGSITVKDREISLESNRDKVQNLNLLEIKLFNDYYNKGSIALLFDGFDEISPDYEQKVIELLQVLKNTKVEKIWVTTRPYGIINQLEDKLSTFSYTLEPLSPHDQRSFLEKFWKNNLKLSELDKKRCNIFINTLFEMFSQCIGDQDREFFTIPLQTWMIALIFQDEFKRFYDSREEKPSDELQKKIKEMDLVTLYERFIEKKFKIRIGEKNPGVNTANPDSKKMIERERKKFIADHGKLAVYSVFKDDEVRKLLPKKEIGEIRNLLKDLQQGKENSGILVRVTDNKPRFIHRTFAEYFAVKSISDGLKSKYVKRRWEFLINIILLEDYHNIRRFFESKLANDHELVNLSSKKPHKEKVLELLLKVGEKDKIEESKNPLCVAAEEGLIKTVDFLLQSAKGDTDRLIKIINSVGTNGSPLCLAIKNDHSKIVEVLLKYMKDVDHNRLVEIINCDDCVNKLPLYLAVERKNSEIVNIMLKDIEDNNQLVKILSFPEDDGPRSALKLDVINVDGILLPYIQKLFPNQIIKVLEVTGAWNAAVRAGNFNFINVIESLLGRPPFRKVKQEVCVEDSFSNCFEDSTSNDSNHSDVDK